MADAVAVLFPIDALSHKAISTDLALTSPQGSPTMSAVEGTSAVIIVGRCIRHRPCPRARSVGRPQRSESRNSSHDANDALPTLSKY